MADQNKHMPSMANQFSGLPIRELIGAPLVAAAQANNMMAMAQTRFILETCFVQPQGSSTEVYKPIMINMTVTRPVIEANGTQAESVESDFSLPLLTIIPLNSLAVDNVNVSFEMEVKTSFSKENSNNKNTSLESKDSIVQKISDHEISAELTGAVAGSSKTGSLDQSLSKQSNAAKYEINAHAGQIPLPLGVTTIIETYSKSIAPIQLKDN